MSTPRLPPLQPSELNPEQATFLKSYTDKRGNYPNIFGTLARHMQLVNAWSEFGLYTMLHSQVDPVLREVAILRTALHVGSDYEWSHHCDIGRRLGMADALFDRIKAGQPLDSPEQDLMVQCADDLAEGHSLSDATWTAMQQTFGETYTLDVIFTVGAYTTMGMALNSCDVQVET